MKALFRTGPKCLGERYTGPRKYRLFTTRLMLWVYVYLVRHFTPIGASLFVVSFLYSEVVMQASPRSPSHLPPFVVLALFLTSYMVGYFMRPTMRVHRSLPSRVTAGEEICVSYDLENRVHRPVWDVVLDMMPMPRGLKFSQGRASLEILSPKQRERTKAYLKASRRGKYILPEVRADTSFPFNIWRWGCEGDGGRQLTVHPFFVPLESLDMTFGLRYQPGGVALSSNVGGYEEFLGCRKYCYGDDVKNIHWRSWARVGEPVVNDFRDEYLCRTALIMDTKRNSGVKSFLMTSDAVFEAAVSLTASIAAFLAQSEYLVELFAAGPQVYRFTCGRSLAYLDDILDVLSCIEPHPGEPMDQLALEITEERLKLSSAIVVLLCWNEARRQLVESLMEAGVAVKVVLVTDKGRKVKGLPDSVEIVSDEDIREGKCLSL